MNFIHFEDFNAIGKYQNDWNRLLALSASHVPFLTFEYQQAWWQTRGGGEWPEDSRLAIVAAFEQEKLVGIAPLFFAKNPQEVPAMMFVGAVEVSDFLDFIVEPENLQQFITGLCDFLTNSKDLPAWKVLDFYNILEDSPSLKILNEEADRRGWDYHQTPLQPAPFVPLPGDFEGYLGGIDKKQRHEIRRKMRNVEQSLVEDKLVFTESPADLEADVDDFINMMAQDPNKRDFLNPKMRQHIQNTARVAFDSGWLQLAFLTLEGEKAAANLSFIFNNRLWLYNSGWEWDFRELSPGWVLLAYLIRWGTENGISEFDFMRGDEPYKYKFGGIDRRIFRATLIP
jgi:CelD/BcsL family acetyltransferase involved in cellulose biosynthesis